MVSCPVLVDPKLYCFVTGMFHRFVNNLHSFLHNLCSCCKKDENDWDYEVESCLQTQKVRDDVERCVGRRKLTGSDSQ